MAALQGRSCDDVIRALTGTEAVEEFWRRVEDNLRAGRVRLLFVADEIPSEPRRLAEFLNEHVPRVEPVLLLAVAAGRVRPSRLVVRSGLRHPQFPLVPASVAADGSTE